MIAIKNEKPIKHGITAVQGTGVGQGVLGAPEQNSSQTVGRHLWASHHPAQMAGMDKKDKEVKIIGSDLKDHPTQGSMLGTVGD